MTRVSTAVGAFVALSALATPAAAMGKDYGPPAPTPSDGEFARCGGCGGRCALLRPFLNPGVDVYLSFYSDLLSVRSSPFEKNIQNLVKSPYQSSDTRSRGTWSDLERQVSQLPMSVPTAVRVCLCGAETISKCLVTVGAAI